MIILTLPPKTYAKYLSLRREYVAKPQASIASVLRDVLYVAHPTAKIVVRAAKRKTKP